MKEWNVTEMIADKFDVPFMPHTNFTVSISSCPNNTVNVIADVLIDRENGEGLAKKIIQFANQVAAEKGHPGLIARDLFLALGRAVN